MLTGFKLAHGAVKAKRLLSRLGPFLFDVDFTGAQPFGGGFDLKLDGRAGFRV